MRETLFCLPSKQTEQAGRQSKQKKKKKTVSDDQARPWLPGEWGTDSLFGTGADALMKTCLMKKKRSGPGLRDASSLSLFVSLLAG
jgi:hypothetical protein